MDARRRPLRAVGQKGLSDAGMRQIRGTRQPKPNSRAGATPRPNIATYSIYNEARSPLARETRRSRSSRVLPRHLPQRYEHGLSVVQAESCEMDDSQQSHRSQEVAARARRSGSLRPRSGRNATACTANEPPSRCPGCCSARPLPDNMGSVVPRLLRTSNPETEGARDAPNRFSGIASTRAISSEHSGAFNAA